MKLNWAEKQKSGTSIPTDFLRLISREMLLDNLISKSVADALDEFLIDLKIEERSPKTLRFYRERIRWFVDFIKPETLLKDIGTGDIKKFFGMENTAHVYGYHAKYRALRAFLNWCIKQSYIIVSPLTFSAPKLPDVIKPAFTDDELKRIINACQGTLALRNRAMVLVLIDTGIRREELARIKITDINLDARLISIIGKGRKERVMPVSPTTLKAIWQYLRARRNPSESLWLSEEGRPLTGDGVGQMVQGLMRKAGITEHKASPHVFRHTFANGFLDAGGDPLDLMYLLGHASLKMVENYSRAHKQRRALKALEKQRPVDRLIK